METIYVLLIITVIWAALLSVVSAFYLVDWIKSVQIKEVKRTGSHTAKWGIPFLRSYLAVVEFSRRGGTNWVELHSGVSIGTIRISRVREWNNGSLEENYSLIQQALPWNIGKLNRSRKEKGKPIYLTD